VFENVFISFCIENFKITLFSVQTISAWIRDQYLLYHTLTATALFEKFLTLQTFKITIGYYTLFLDLSVMVLVMQ